MAMEGYRETDIHECCGNCGHLKGFGLRSHACELETKKVPDALYSEDDNLTDAYYYTCNSFKLDGRFKTS